MGIEQIKNYIKDKVEEKVQDVLRRAHLVKEREISQAKKKLDLWIEEQTKAFMREKISLIAQYKARTYREMSLEETKLKEQLWIDFFAAVKERVESLRSDHQKYSTLLLRFMESARKYYSNGVNVLVNPNDVSLMKDLIEMHYKGVDISVFPESSVRIGFVLVDKDRGAKVNYDILTILEAERERIKMYFFSKLMDKR